MQPVRLSLTITASIGLALCAAACGNSSSASHSSSVASATSLITHAASSARPASGCSSLLATANPAPTAAPTPKLTELLARVGRRSPASIRFRTRICVGTVSPPRTLTQIGSMRIRPHIAGSINETISGHSVQVRFVGAQAYVHLPRLAARDGGRPWLSVSIQRAGAAIGLNLSELLNQVPRLNPGQDPLLLKGARLFKSLGQTTVAGRRVNVYRITVDPRSLPQIGLPADLVKQIEAQVRALGATSEVVTSYLTSAGSTVRTVTMLSGASKLLNVSVIDLLATNQPLHVSAPPASQTIAYSKVAKG